MQNTLALYASKKLLPFLGKPFEKELKEVDPKELNPLFCWYGDVYYLKKVKYLIICNEVSRFSWILGPYSVSSKVNFMDLFQTELQKALEKIIPDSDHYFGHIAGLGKITQSHLGAVATINRLKIELDYLKTSYPHFEDREFLLPDDFWRMADSYTSRGTEKGYFKPNERFRDLWKVFGKKNME